MNGHVNSIAGRLSLRPPQRRSLEILDHVCKLVPPRKGTDRAAALAAVHAEFPSVTDFERDFPSLCFALATGVGKTRLMGAFVSYLYLEHGIKNFYILAPNLTIYWKLIADFTPNTPKYVFQGVEGFAVTPPVVITGDNYESQAGGLFDRPDDCKVNIFNISKINSEVRGGKSPRIKRLSEYLGESYFEYLAKLPDLVLLMDESHRYRASAGVKAINDLKPTMGLELTATPFTEGARGVPVPFKNVVYDYALARAMADGFVKEPAVVTRKDFHPAGMKPEELERIKLEDGVRLHEGVKVELETYARQTNQRIVKPFVLVIARDTTHAAELLAKVQADDFFAGRYKGRAIQVDSSQTGAKEDEMVERLLKVESADEPTEIVIHVNMLKEGWDVTNLYTIIPLRAANARTLVVQSIGRGLRLPYGRRSGLTVESEGKQIKHPVDRLNIVAHDMFAAILDDSRRPDSPLQMQFLVLDPDEMARKTVTVVSEPRVAELFRPEAPAAESPAGQTGALPTPLFPTEADRKVAEATYDVIRSLQPRPLEVPTLAALQTPAVQAKVLAAVRERLGPTQLTLPGLGFDLARVVATMTEQVVLGTIDIPRIVVVPSGVVSSGYKPFTLSVAALRYPVPSEELWLQTLRTGERQVISVGRGGVEEQRLEDYVVGGLVDFDDVSYDDHAELLYDLAAQTVTHFRVALNYSDDDIRKVLRQNQKAIAEFVHAQMLPHYWEEAGGYEVTVTRGFTDLKGSAYTASAGVALGFHAPPADKTKIGQSVYGGFARCLYRLQKFQSDTERQMALILDRDSARWFRPALGQFQIFYKVGHDQQEYQPDFVAESATAVSMVETKRRSCLQDADVLAKRDAGVQWSRHASDYAAKHGGKPWRYLLIPHDVVAENMTLEGLAEQYVQRGDLIPLPAQDVTV